MTRSVSALAGEEAVKHALERASLYRVLGAAFAYPGPDRLPALAGLAEAVAAAQPRELAKGLRRLAMAARAADPAALADEHVFLFDRGPCCPPYEGAWGDAPSLAGKSALLADIAGFYAAFGLAPAEASPDMEDHVAAELEFMSVLALKEAYALAEGESEGVEVARRAQTSFVGDHLGRWTEAFAAGLREATPVPYYGALADLLEWWMRAEVETLGAAPDRVSGRLGGDPIQEGEAFTCPMVPPDPRAGC